MKSVRRKWLLWLLALGIISVAIFTVWMGLARRQAPAKATGYVAERAKERYRDKPISFSDFNFNLWTPDDESKSEQELERIISEKMMQWILEQEKKALGQIYSVNH